MKFTTLAAIALATTTAYADIPTFESWMEQHQFHWEKGIGEELQKTYNKFLSMGLNFGDNTWHFVISKGKAEGLEKTIQRQTAMVSGITKREQTTKAANGCLKRVRKLCNIVVKFGLFKDTSNIEHLIDLFEDIESFEKPLKDCGSKLCAHLIVLKALRI